MPAGSTWKMRSVIGKHDDATRRDTKHETDHQQQNAKTTTMRAMINNILLKMTKRVSREWAG